MFLTIVQQFLLNKRLNKMKISFKVVINFHPFQTISKTLIQNLKMCFQLYDFGAPEASHHSFLLF